MTSTPTLVVEFDAPPPTWLLDAVRAGVGLAGWNELVADVPLDFLPWSKTPGTVVCAIAREGADSQRDLRKMATGVPLLLVTVGREQAFEHDPDVIALGTHEQQPHYYDLVQGRVAAWLDRQRPSLDGELRKEIERFCGWVERKLTQNGALEDLLEAAEAPARTDRDLKHTLVQTRAALDQTSRLVEALRAELLKAYPGADTTPLVAKALASSGALAAGFALGVLATMTVAGVTGVGGALIVGAGGNAVYDALKATLESARKEIGARGAVLTTTDVDHVDEPPDNDFTRRPFPGKA